MNTPMLHATHLTVGYQQGKEALPVLAHLDLALHAGEVVCLIGPNGSGKSTLLRTLAGMHPPLSGRVMLGGTDVHAMSARERARHLALVLSRRVEVGRLTAREVVALGRQPYTGWWGRLAARDWDIVDDALHAVGASDLAHRDVSTLSDGEWQKVMIARALAQEPQVMILDEPTAFLDVHHRAEIMALLRSLAHDRGRAVLLSTHDLDLALHTADRLWAITPEKAVRAGAPEDLVLDGVLERTFPSRHVIFDITTGTFRVPLRVRGEVRLVGTGVRAYWTRRALERSGWRVVEDQERTPLLVQVIAQGKRTAWLVTANSQRRICHSLLDLVSYLHQLELGEWRLESEEPRVISNLQSPIPNL